MRNPITFLRERFGNTPKSRPSPTSLVPTRTAYRRSPYTTSSPVQISASSSHPYEGASAGRRGKEWNTTRLGPTTLLWGNLDLLRSRCRDEIRNNPLGASACDNFESQTIGHGIRPCWNIKDATLKQLIEKKFDNWAKTTAIDANGQSNFYALQALAAREVFEAGEVIARFLVKPSAWKKTKVPLVIKLMEGEQLPVFHNVAPSNGGDNLAVGHCIRTGKEYNENGELVAFWFYKEHPGETMFYPLSGLTYQRVPAEDILHVFKPLRAGQLRGSPFLASVIVLLYEIGQYTDASIVKKKIAAMFAGFIEKTDPNADLLPPDPNDGSTGTIDISNSPETNYADPGTRDAKIESGTLQELNIGEKITFPTPPQEADLKAFFDIFLHQFAVAIGATYEQITGDLRGVNLSSIRAGILDMRRKCEQLQRYVFVTQFVYPIVKRWLFEAVMCGELKLPGYAQDPEPYEDISFALPGWPWLDPFKDAQANALNVRGGFDSRENIVAGSGGDVTVIDSQQQSDNDRADSKGLIYDTRTDLVLDKGQNLTPKGSAEEGVDSNADAGEESDSVPATSEENDAKNATSTGASESVTIPTEEEMEDE
jgi:lambda family phage portal protein